MFCSKTVDRNDECLGRKSKIVPPTEAVWAYIRLLQPEVCWVIISLGMVLDEKSARWSCLYPPQFPAPSQRASKPQQRGMDTRLPPQCHSSGLSTCSSSLIPALALVHGIVDYLFMCLSSPIEVFLQSTSPVSFISASVERWMDSWMDEWMVG